MFNALCTLNEDIWQEAKDALLDGGIEWSQRTQERRDGSSAFYIDVADADADRALRVVDEVQANFQR